MTCPHVPRNCRPMLIDSDSQGGISLGDSCKFEVSKHVKRQDFSSSESRSDGGASQNQISVHRADPLDVWNYQSHSYSYLDLIVMYQEI